MNSYKSLVTICLLAFNFAVNAEVVIGEVKSKLGTFKIEGKAFNQQVFLYTAQKNKKLITHFQHWDAISHLYLSPDERYLLIYHKPDKKPTKLTLIDTTNFKILGETFPGSIGSPVWYKKSILWETEVTPYSTLIVNIFDLKLKNIGGFTIGGEISNEDFDLGYVIDIPSCMVGHSETKVSIYSLDDAHVIDQVDFKKLINTPFLLDGGFKTADNTYSISVQMGKNCGEDLEDTHNEKEFQLKIEPDKFKQLKISVKELKHAGK